jgi:hypothetical protein
MTDVTLGEQTGAEKNGDPGWILTNDLPLRRRTLYTAELRDREEVGETRSRGDLDSHVVFN